MLHDEVEIGGKVEKVLVIDVLEVIIFDALDDLAKAVGARDNETNELNKQRIKQTVFNQYAHRISLKGLLHCFWLIQTAVPPFDQELYGLTPRPICAMIGKYCTKLEAKKIEFENEEKQVKGTEKAENPFLENPEIKKEFEQLSTKMIVKFSQAFVLRKENRLFNSIQDYCNYSKDNVELLTNQLQERWLREYEEWKQSEEFNPQVSASSFVSAKLQSWLTDVSKIAKDEMNKNKIVEDAEIIEETPCQQKQINS